MLTRVQYFIRFSLENSIPPHICRVWLNMANPTTRLIEGADVGYLVEGFRASM
jgi:hypothetical protein